MGEVKSSGTVSIYSKVLEKQQKGEKVYNFSAGDIILKNHPVITEGVRNFIEGSFITYPTAQGDLGLRQKVAEWLNETCSIEFDPREVIVTPGGKYALYSLLFTLLSRGEEVLIPSPYWVSYPELVKMNGGIPKIIHTTRNHHWKLLPEMIKEHVSPNSRFLIFNNACNPTGAVYPREEVRALLEEAAQAGLIVLSDEVYSGLVYDQPYISCASFKEFKKNVYVIQSCSKNFAMSGWRVGFGMGNPEQIQKVQQFLSQTTTGVSPVSQAAALAALTHHKEVNLDVKEHLRSSRDVFFDTLNALFFLDVEKSPSALYSFLSLKELGVKGTDSVTFCNDVLNRGNIALTPGIFFGQEGFVRFSFSDPPEKIQEGLMALKQLI